MPNSLWDFEIQERNLKKWNIREIDFWNKLFYKVVDVWIKIILRTRISEGLTEKRGKQVWFFLISFIDIALEGKVWYRLGLFWRPASINNVTKDTRRWWVRALFSNYIQYWGSFDFLDSLGLFLSFLTPLRYFSAELIIKELKISFSSEMCSESTWSIISSKILPYLFQFALEQ